MKKVLLFLFLLASVNVNAQTGGGLSYVWPVSQQETFNPVDLNPVLYLDAARNITESGGAVSNWGNLGTGTTDAFQSTGSAQPTYNASGFGVNNQPYLDFDGTNHFLGVGTEYSKLPNHTVFTVVELDDVGSNGDIIREGNSSANSRTGGIRHGHRANIWETSYGQGIADGNFRFYQEQSENLAIATPYIFVDTKLNGVALNQFYKNGTNLPLTDVFGGAATNISGTIFNMSIARAGESSTNYFNGKIAEVIIFDYVLDSTQLDQVTTYLQDKYGI